MNEILIVPFFIPHMGCPFKCAFCNQWKITGVQTYSHEIVAQKVQEALGTVKKRPDRIETAFFGGSFTGLTEEEQIFWLKQALELKNKGIITGIRLSTRPDYISEEILKRLLLYGVTTIELGVQSLVDDILNKSKRGHSSADTYRATELIREYPFDLIYQLMLGLPGDDCSTALFTAEQTVRVKPDGIRVYPTVVLKDTALAKSYAQGLYEPWSLDEAVKVGARWLGIFSYYRIPVIRMGLQATENLRTDHDLLAGPYHPAYRELVESRLMLDQLIEAISRIKDKNDGVRIIFNCRDYSKVIGHKKVNHDTLKAFFPSTVLEFYPDKFMQKNDIRLEFDDGGFCLTRQEFLEKYRI